MYSRLRCEGLGGGPPCDTPQFPPPPGCNATCWGYQPDPAKHAATLEIPAIVDRVRVPKDLPPGDYVVGCYAGIHLWLIIQDD